ncbi:MAG: hypothetical protein WC955_09685 [Elusimicrobiota bacterium]
MKRFIAVLLTVVLMSSASAVFATQSRMEGMGLSNWMAEDDYNIWDNPARLVQYPGLVWGELGIPTAPMSYTQWAGVSSKKMPIGTIAAFVGRPYSGSITSMYSAVSGMDLTAVPVAINSANVTGAALTCAMSTVLTPFNHLDLFWSISPQLAVWVNMADHYDTLSHTYTSTTRANGDGTAKSDRGTAEYNFGVGTMLEKLGPIESLDVAVKIGLPFVTNIYSERWYVAAQNREGSDDREFKSNGAFTFDFYARWFLRIMQTSKLMMFSNVSMNGLGSLYTDKRDANADGTLDVNTKQTRNLGVYGFNFGAGDVMPLGDRTTLYAALSLKISQSSYSGKTENLINTTTTEEYAASTFGLGVPLNFAIEHKVSKVFTLRGGLEQLLWKNGVLDVNDNDWAANAVVSNAKYQTVTTGIGNITFNFGATANISNSLVIDAVLNQDVFFSGTYIVSGRTNYPLSRITLTYKFK